MRTQTRQGRVDRDHEGRRATDIETLIEVRDGLFQIGAVNAAVRILRRLNAGAEQPAAPPQQMPQMTSRDVLLEIMMKCFTSWVTD